MSKINEINYIDNLVKELSLEEKYVENYLLNKPYSDQRRGWYLMDVAQILKHLPQPPARLLDIGVGSGWTSKIFAMSGYQVVGLDIAPSMIKLAKANCAEFSNTEFHVCDYENNIDFGQFDCAVVYDALHHSIEDKKVVKNIYQHLVKGGVFITIEPGRGHSKTADTLDTIRRFGTTEKDMEFSYQNKIMKEAGFSKVMQFYRLCELPVEDINTLFGPHKQLKHFKALDLHVRKEGFTSIVVAVK